MIQDLERYLEQLIARYEKVKAENASLKKSLSECTDKLETYRSRTEILEKKISSLQLSEAFVSSAGKDNKEARRRVERLIREIDKCIELLGE